MSEPNVLLIDDEVIALTNLTHVLKREGYRVTACKDGEAGLAAFKQSDFDLVLTDLKMPGVDGMAVLREVRAHHPDVPVIVITGHATLDSAVEAMKAGACHYIAKPFRLAEAREVVRGALEMRRVKRENQDLRLRIEQLKNPHTLITQDLGMQRLLESPAGRHHRQQHRDPRRVGHRQGTAGALRPPVQPPRLVLLRQI